jgi:hypothetical protein
MAMIVLWHEREVRGKAPRNPFLSTYMDLIQFANRCDLLARHGWKTTLNNSRSALDESFLRNVHEYITFHANDLKGLPIKPLNFLAFNRPRSEVRDSTRLDILPALNNEHPLVIEITSGMGYLFQGS